MVGKPFESMNMVPFIDVMLVLLTIVLTTSSFIASGRIPVNLPKAGAAASAAHETETIEIDARGHVFLDGVAVDAGQLRAGLGAKSRETPFLLRADKAVALQHFIAVADLLRELGFARMAVQVEAARP